MRYVLGLDSAMAGCGAALYDISNPTGSVGEYMPMHRGQAEALVPLVQDTVEKAGIHFSDIDLIVTTTGPGAFTGLRVGLSAAQSFALALGLPIIGMNCFDVLSAQFFKDNELKADEKLLVLIESKRDDFFCQFFDKGGNAVELPDSLSFEVIQNKLSEGAFVCIGDAVPRFETELGVTTSNIRINNYYNFPDMQMLCELGHKIFMEQDALENVGPLYLRGADVSKPKNALRKIGF